MIRTVELEAIKAVVDHAAAYDAVHNALVRLAAGEVVAPDEMALLVQPDGDIHVKGAHIGGEPWIVFKVASGGFPAAPNAGCSFLLNASTGSPTFVFDDGGWLTEMRTAAAGAIAADVLANPGPVRVAILGTGIQARFQLEALRARREVTDVHVWGRSLDRTTALAAEVNATAHASVAEAVAAVDVVVTTTSATVPILEATVLPAGVHITAMGSDTIGKRELGATVLDTAAIIAADDVATCARVGELQHAAPHLDRAVALADLVAGKVPGRTNPAQITVADLCGIGTYDAAIAGLVASRVSEGV